MSKKYKIGPSNHGLGMFAAGQYQPGQVIIKIEGNLVHWRTLLGLSGVIQDNAFRYSNNYYLSPSGAGNYINHSCNPNAGVFKTGTGLILKAVTGIAPGDQITFDYSTVLGNDDSWVMKCGCGFKACRKRIKSFGSLPPAVRTRYLEWGAVPEYVVNT